MANRRSISKSISLSEQVDLVSDQAALLFSWMFPHADDFGRLPGSARKLGALVVPLRLNRPGWTVEDIEGYLAEMEGARDEAGVPLLYRYLADGIPVIQLVKFDSHQEGLHKRTRSKFPDPTEPFPEYPGISGNIREIPASRARAETKGREGNRNEGKGREQNGPPIPPAPAPNLYSRFEKDFGRPLSPTECEQITKWQEAHDPDVVMEALRRAVLNGKFNMRYIDSILLNWEKAGRRTLREVLEHEEAYARAKGKAAPVEEDPAKVIQLDQKRREETVRAACDYIKLHLGPAPSRDAAEEMAAEYGEDLVPDIMGRLLGGGEPP